MDLAAFFTSLLSPAEPDFQIPEPSDCVELSLDARSTLDIELADQPAWSRPTSIEQVLTLGRIRYGSSHPATGPAPMFAPPTFRPWGNPLALMR